MATIKRKVQGGSSSTNLLILVGIFAFSTLLLADYLVIKTMGEVQILLTIFVIVFPVLIVSGFFYFLLNPDYLLFSSPKIGTEDVMKGQIEAVKTYRNKKREYDPAIHALIGVLEAARLNAPIMIQRRADENPVLPIQINIGVFPPVREKSDQVKKFTTGTVTREEAAKRFHFLGNTCRKDSIMEAIKQLVKSNKSFHVWIEQNGSAEENSETDSIEESIHLSSTQSGERKTKDSDYIYVQIIHALHDQLIVVYFQSELLGFPGSQTLRFVKGMQSIKSPYDYSALVISDQGDLYGTMEDVVQRAKFPRS